MQFKDSSTIPETGYSYVIVQHCGNEYMGKAKCHPDDEWSEFTGCRYAHQRAEINALKDEWRKKKAACEECRKFVVAVSQYSNFDKESLTAKVMFRQLNRRIKEVNQLAEKISKLEFNLRVLIRQQDKAKNLINQNRKTNN